MDKALRTTKVPLIKPREQVGYVQFHLCRGPKNQEAGVQVSHHSKESEMEEVILRGLVWGSRLCYSKQYSMKCKGF